MKTPPKNLPSNVDVHILLQLHMQGLIPQGNNRLVGQLVTDKDYWHPPPQGYMKCNIDGASKEIWAWLVMGE